jgi:putative ABC transport system permease protein
MREIVGVVANARHGGFDTAPVPEMYVPFAQRPVSNFSMVVRAAGSPSALQATIRETLAAIDPDQPIANLRSLTDIVDASLARPRFNTWLLTAFAALALALASLGVYGVLSYAVSLRTREFGVRMALGMPARDGARLVLADGLRLTLAGIALGLIGAWALSRALSTLLFDMRATDVPTYAAVSGVLVVTCVTACVIPARRAMSVDPVTALRQE